MTAAVSQSDRILKKVISCRREGFDRPQQVSLSLLLLALESKMMWADKTDG